MKVKQDKFWSLVSEYLDEYLPKVRRMSRGTIVTYRYGLYSFGNYLEKIHDIQPHNISFDSFTREKVKEYVSWMTKEARLAIATSNLKVSIIKSFLRFCSGEDIQYMPIYMAIAAIPLQKSPQKMVEYMSENGLKIFLKQPDPNTMFGARDRMILIFMYDTACRVQELVDVKVQDLNIDYDVPFVKLSGKGNKKRNVPLMDKTVEHLKQYLRSYQGKDKTHPLFYTKKNGQPMGLSTDAISILVKKYGQQGHSVCGEVPKRCYPHLLRKTRSMHLYMKGMPLEQVANFLGHANSATISYYAKANTEMLRKSIEKANPEVVGEARMWKEPHLLKRLCGL
jgi:integrase/recombinase XerD